MSRITNFFDRCVYAISPERGEARAKARYRKEFTDRAAELARLKMERKRREYASGGGFQSAENSTDAASWLTSKLSPDSALEADRPLMIERADSSYKNFGLAVSHVEGRVIRVAGCGFTLQPELDPEDIGVSEAEAEAMNKTLRKAWERLVQRLGKHGEWLYEIQQQMVRYWERRGEFFLLFGDEYDPLSPVSEKVEVIHPDRVSTPPGEDGKNVRMGIQLDDKGKAVGAWVKDSQPGDTKDITEKWTYYPHFQSNGLPRLFHHFDRRDSRQHRGYPRMQVGAKDLKNTEEFDEAETERNYVSACMAAFVRTETPAADQMLADGVVEDSTGKRLRDIQPSMIHYMGPADEVQFSNPTGAPATYSAFMESHERKFAIGAGTPYEMLTGNWGSLAYNAAKIIWNMDEAAVDVAQMGHIKALLWIYAHFVTDMITTGQIPVDILAYRSQPWLYWAVRVIPPARASIDPPKEDRNDLVNVESCVIPHSAIVERKTGEPYETVLRRVARDRATLKKYGLPENMPGVVQGGQSQPGDTNQASSDANNERQTVGA